MSETPLTFISRSKMKCENIAMFTDPMRQIFIDFSSGCYMWIACMHTNWEVVG